MPPKIRRPTAVTWLAIAVFLLSVVNLGGVYAGLTRRSVFATLDLSLPIWVIAASGGVWGIVWLAVTWGLWRLRPWARRAMLAVFPLYEIITIGRQVIFAQGPYESGRLPFAVGVAILLVLAISFTLTRPRIRRAFEPDHEET